jgi:hypothetical protein
MAKKQLPLRVDEAVLKKLQEFAKKDSRPLSNYVETVLKNYVNKKKGS